MKLTVLRFAAAFAAVCFVATADAADMTNADVIKLVQAKLDDAVILTAIDNSSPRFDTSAQGLIELTTAKVPQEIVTAIIKKAAGPAPKAESAAVPAGAAQAAAAPAPVAAEPPADETMAPSEVLMVDGDKVAPMRYLNPQMRTAARALGFGGVASYAVLRNHAAGTRTKNRSPAFLVCVPDQAQPESYLTLASFAVRQNNSREVMIGGGYMSYSTGIHPDRVIQITSEKAADQSRAKKGFTIYRVSPRRPLGTGEYALILYTAEVRAMVATWFSGTGNSYFDFGVDP